MLMNNIILEFTFNKVYTFGSNDLEHRFIIRNFVLTDDNIKFKKHLMNVKSKYKVSLDIKRNKLKWDIDNVPKVVIDSFSQEQIKHDLYELDVYLNPSLHKKKLSKTKQNAYDNIFRKGLFLKDKDYDSLGIYAEDTIEYVTELYCIGEYVPDLIGDKINIKIEVIIENTK